MKPKVMSRNTRLLIDHEYLYDEGSESFCWIDYILYIIESPFILLIDSYDLSDEMCLFGKNIFSFKCLGLQDKGGS